MELAGILEQAQIRDIIHNSVKSQATNRKDKETDP